MMCIVGWRGDGGEGRGDELVIAGTGGSSVVEAGRNGWAVAVFWIGLDCFCFTPVCEREREKLS